MLGENDQVESANKKTRFKEKKSNIREDYNNVSLKILQKN